MVLSSDDRIYLILFILARMHKFETISIRTLCVTEFKMADSEDEHRSPPSRNDSAQLLAMMKAMSDNVNELKDNGRKQEARLNSLEKKLTAPPSDNNVAHNSQSMHVDEGSDNDDYFQPSQKSFGKADEVLVDVSPQMEFQFEDIISEVKVGENVDDQLVVSLQRALLGVDDKEKLAKMVEKNPRPGNLPELVVPMLNKEIKPDMHIINKENQLCGIQRNVTTALSILIELLNDVGKSEDRKFERADIYSKTNQAITMLMSSHKGLTMARKMNVKYSLARGIQHLCTRDHVDHSKRRRNEDLFEEDLSCEVETSFRMSRTVQKVASKNGQGRGRGRGQFRFPQAAARGVGRTYQYSNKKKSGSSTKGRGRGRPLGPQF